MRSRFRLTSPKPPKLAEADVIKGCKNFLSYHGYRLTRQHVGLFKTPDNRWIRMGEPGLPDYCVPAFMIEFKRPGAVLTPEQVTKIHELEIGWRLKTAVIDSVENMAAWLDGYEKGRRAMLDLK